MTVIGGTETSRGSMSLNGDLRSHVVRHQDLYFVRTLKEVLVFKSFFTGRVIGEVISSSLNYQTINEVGTSPSLRRLT